PCADRPRHWRARPGRDRALDHGGDRRHSARQRQQPGMRVGALVLAAGRSTRMAPDNKLLVEIDGEAMVRRVARLALASGASPVIVGTGQEPQRVAQSLHGLDVEVPHNPAYPDGMSPSLCAGVAAPPAGIDGAMVLLGDMPWIETSVLETLIG